MRLINTETLQLHEFFDAAVPSYVILSHTWGLEEVTFQDWLYARQQNPPRWGWVYIEEEVDKVKAKPGYIKIETACRQALTDHFSWIWVDTNCIDKTNSAELSEAINSMYQWYQKAEVCYAYLADVPLSSPEECAKPGSKFRSSRWFTRGWTLQELIAPERVVFFSQSWTPMCEKREVATTIQDITNIPCEVIIESRHLTCGHASIAEIMSWAATRTTTRAEDMAYCLMGLLRINMPLLYGEGRSAFLRLQLEIIQKASDVTFLAWQRVLLQPRRVTGIDLRFGALIELETFASGPEAFCFSRCIHGTNTPPAARGGLGASHWWTDNPRSLRINNLGLSLSLPLVETLLPSFQYAVLPFAQRGRALWIPLMESDHLRARVEFPSVTLSVSNIGYTARETEITLPIYHGNSRQRGAPALAYPIPTLGYGRRSTTNILLAFPAGLHSYRLLQQFPSTAEFNLMSNLILCLCVDDDLPTIAYGAIEFEKSLEPYPSEATGKNSQTPHGSRLAVLFAVDLGDSDHPGPRRWTCRDISRARFDKSYLSYSHYAYDLELRARSQLVCLTDPSSDELVSSTWEPRSLLRWEGARAGHGIIFLDELVCDISNAEFVLRRSDNDGAGSDMTSEDSCRPKETVIVAQIIFPGQGYEERSSLHGTRELV